ncbi:hypothetical protein BTVI_97035 [Pitangus sulphuratus]|nr:hypothetical protein BTVI_97035 [Pitangus sulphuratus]
MERGIHTGVDLLAGFVTVQGTHTGAVHEELQPMGRIDVGDVCGGLAPVEGTPCWSGEEHEESSLAEGGDAETQPDQLTTTSMPHPPALLEVEQLGVTLRLGRREGTPSFGYLALEHFQAQKPECFQIPIPTNVKFEETKEEDCGKGNIFP